MIPYMHNGIFETLKEVIDFYKKGGMNLPQQTLPAEKLNLTPDEKSDCGFFENTD